MPLPSDKVQIERTFRRCAADPVGTSYHQQYFALPEGVAIFGIERAVESLRGTLILPTKPVVGRVLKLGPVLHGDFTLLPTGFSWDYSHFGDCVFSSLKSGSYRDTLAKEWGTRDVFEDSIDEVRRVLGMQVVVEKSAVVIEKEASTFGVSRRRILR